MSGALSPQQVAERLGVSRDVVLRLVRSGRLPAVKLGWRTWRVTEEALQAFMAGKTPATPSTPSKQHETGSTEKVTGKPRKRH